MGGIGSSLKKVGGELVEEWSRKDSCRAKWMGGTAVG